LTQLANALVNSSCPLEGGNVLRFVSTKLDWVNTLENTPITATVYSKKTRPNDDDVESDDEEHEPGGGEDSDESDEDPEPAMLSPARVLGKSRLDILTVSNPKPVGDYSSPPRPRLPLQEGTDSEEKGLSAVAVPSKNEVDEVVAEEIFNEHSFWRLPIQEFF
jgi:hypothetical protein